MCPAGGAAGGGKAKKKFMALDAEIVRQLQPLHAHQLGVILTARSGITTHLYDAIISDLERGCPISGAALAAPSTARWPLSLAPAQLHCARAQHCCGPCSHGTTPLCLCAGCAKRLNDCSQRQLANAELLYYKIAQHHVGKQRRGQAQRTIDSMLRSSAAQPAQLQHQERGPPAPFDVTGSLFKAVTVSAAYLTDVVLACVEPLLQLIERSWPRTYRGRWAAHCRPLHLALLHLCPPVSTLASVLVLACLRSAHML